MQILYSHDIIIDGLVIRNNEGGRDPSIDGIDIDSSRRVEVVHADIEADDDALCLKSGRDSDGLRVNRPTEDVRIHDSIIHKGAAAITIGSETSESFHKIEVWNITAEAGVPNGVLFKSAHTRGGIASDIRIHDLTMTGVATPIFMTMNWNPSYSYGVLPAGMDIKSAPPYWVQLTTPVSDAKGRPHFSGVDIWNIKATGARRASSVEAYADAPLSNFKFDRLDIQAADAGAIADAKDWTFSDIKLKTVNGSSVKVTDSTNVTACPTLRPRWPRPHPRASSGIERFNVKRGFRRRTACNCPGNPLRRSSIRTPSFPAPSYPKCGWYRGRTR